MGTFGVHVAGYELMLVRWQASVTSVREAVGLHVAPECHDHAEKVLSLLQRADSQSHVTWHARFLKGAVDTADFSNTTLILALSHFSQTDSTFWRRLLRRVANLRPGTRILTQHRIARFVHVRQRHRLQELSRFSIASTTYWVYV